MSDLDRLFYWRGIAPEFYNFRGELTAVPLGNRIRILQAMGVDTSTPESIAREAYELDIKPWLSWLQSLEVADVDSPLLEINVHPDQITQSFDCTISLHEEKVFEETFTPADLPEVGDYTHEGIRYSRRQLAIKALDANYYQVTLSNRIHSETACFAVCPNSAYVPEWIDSPEEKPWGFIIQLYTLKSKRNWGIGDFSDLTYLIQASVSYGVDIIGLNPLHALQAELSQNYSPYSPSDRRFLNPLYIDVERAPGFDEEMMPRVAITQQRTAEHIDYMAMRDIKYAALYASFERYIAVNTSELADFILSEPPSLIEFANFEAMVSWQPDDVMVHAATRSELIDALNSSQTELPLGVQLCAFYCYMQWVARSQLEECQTLASDKGMKVGLIRDLAVGANGSGSEVQTNGHLFCHDASIGAPPDPLALTGQNWGLPPMDPAELRKTGFAHFISLLRENMSSCGALRIDHAMSLYRLWWCPPGATADKGAYIYYPFREMIGLLCLESHLNNCIIIAEDLGVVPDEFKRVMIRAKLYSNKVFYFEKWNNVEFKHPSQYDFHALAMLDNHDVPTVTSWWNGSDLTLRSELNLLEENTSLSAVLEIRALEKSHLLQLLSQDGLLSESWRDAPISKSADNDLINAIILFVSQSRSKFFILQLEDLLMMEDPVNVPGTFLEHKNWSRKLSHDLEDIFSDINIQASLRSISKYRN